MSNRPVLAIVLLGGATLVAAFGLWITFTERGVANEIKGFVLLLIAAVLAGGGSILWELQAIRRALEQRDRQA